MNNNNEEEPIFPPADVFIIKEGIKVQTISERGIDQIYAGKILATMSDLDYLIDKNNLQKLINKNERPFFNSSFPDEAWWKPEQEEVYFAGALNRDNWVIEVLVTRKDEYSYNFYYQVYKL